MHTSSSGSIASHSIAAFQAIIIFISACTPTKRNLQFAQNDNTRVLKEGQSTKRRLTRTHNNPYRCSSQPSSWIDCAKCIDMIAKRPVTLKPLVYKDYLSRVIDGCVAYLAKENQLVRSHELAIYLALIDPTAANVHSLVESLLRLDRCSAAISLVARLDKMRPNFKTARLKGIVAKRCAKRANTIEDRSMVSKRSFESNLKRKDTFVDTVEVLLDTGRRMELSRVRPDAASPKQGRFYRNVAFYKVLERTKKRPTLIVSTGHQEKITAFDMSTNGKFIVTGGKDGVVILWQRRSFDIGAKSIFLVDENRKRHLSSIATNDSGDTIIGTMKSGGIWLKSEEKGRRSIVKMKSKASIKALDLSDTGELAAMADERGAISILDTKSRMEIWKRSYRRFKAVALKLIKSGGPLVAASDKGKIVFLNPRTGAIEGNADCSGVSIKSMSQSPSGRYIALADQENKMMILDRRSGKCLIAAKSLSCEVTTVRYQKAHVLLSGCKNGTLNMYILNPRKGELRKRGIRLFKGTYDNGLGIATSEEGAAVIATRYGRIMIGYVKINGKNLIKIAERLVGERIGQVLAVEIGSKEKHLAIGRSYYKESLIVLALDNGKMKTYRTSVPKFGYQAHEISFDEKEDLVAVGGPWIQVFRVKDGKHILSSINSHRQRTWKYAIRLYHSSKTGRNYIIYPILSRGPRFPTQIVKMDIETAGTSRKVTGFIGSNSNIGPIAVSKIHRQVIGGCQNGKMIVWSMGSRSPIAMWNAHRMRVTTVVLSKNEKLIASGSKDGDVAIWERASGRRIWTFSTKAGPVGDIEFALEGRIIIIASADGHLHIFNWKKGKKIRTIKAHRRGYIAIDALEGHSTERRNNVMIVSGGVDGTVRVWSLNTGRLLITIIQNVTGEWIAFTPKGYYDASIRGERMIKWRAGRGLFHNSLGAPYLHTPGLIRIVLSNKRYHQLEGLKKYVKICVRHSRRSLTLYRAMKAAQLYTFEEFGETADR